MPSNINVDRKNNRAVKRSGGGSIAPHILDMQQTSSKHLSIGGNRKLMVFYSLLPLGKITNQDSNTQYAVVLRPSNDTLFT